MRAAHTQTSISYPDDFLISGDSLEEQTRVKIKFIEFLTLTEQTINPVRTKDPHYSKICLPIIWSPEGRKIPDPIIKQIAYQLLLQKKLRKGQQCLDTGNNTYHIWGSC